MAMNEQTVATQNNMAASQWLLRNKASQKRHEINDTFFRGSYTAN